MIWFIPLFLETIQISGSSYFLGNSNVLSKQVLSKLMHFGMFIFKLDLHQITDILPYCLNQRQPKMTRISGVHENLGRRKIKANKNFGPYMKFLLKGN